MTDAEAKTEAAWAPKYPARKAFDNGSKGVKPEHPSADHDSTLLAVKCIGSAIAAFVIALGMHATPNNPDLPRVIGISILYTIPMFAVIQLSESLFKQRFYSRSTLFSTLALVVTDLYYVMEHDRQNQAIHFVGLGVAVFLIGVFALVDGIRKSRD